MGNDFDIDVQLKNQRLLAAIICKIEKTENKEELISLEFQKNMLLQEIEKHQKLNNRI